MQPQIGDVKQGKTEFDEKIADAERRIAEAEQQLADGWAQYNAGVKKITEEIEKSVQDILDKYSREQIEEKIEEIKKAIEAGQGSPEMEKLLEELFKDAGVATLYRPLHNRERRGACLSIEIRGELSGLWP